MGWKAIKEHYRIEHLVQVVEGKGVCIGSPYIHDIIVITFEGEIAKRYDPGRGCGAIENLQRYQQEMELDPAMLKLVLAYPDRFERSIAVYTYEGAEIIECACEELGWPNVTHDGRMMYENTFSADRAEVVAWAIRSVRSSIEAWEDNVADREKSLAEATSHLERCRADLTTLLQREAA